MKLYFFFILEVLEVELIQRKNNLPPVYTRNNWWQLFLYCGRTSVENSAETDRNVYVIITVNNICLCVCVCVCARTYLSTLSTFPILSSSVNPVMPQYVLLSEGEMLNMFTFFLFTHSVNSIRKNSASLTRIKSRDPLTSRRHRVPPSLKVGLHRKLI